MYVISISPSMMSANELTITAARENTQESARDYVATCRQIDKAFGEATLYEIAPLDAEDLPEYADELRRVYGYCGNDWKIFVAQRSRLPQHCPVAS